MKRAWDFIFTLSVIAWAFVCVGCLYFGSMGKLPIQQKKESPAIEEKSEEPIEAVVVEIAPAIEEEPEWEKMKQIENATLTHYCICERCCGKSPDHPAYGITASGRRAEPYVSVAVDPFLIPLSSKVYIEIDGEIIECRADDVGSGVAGAHIDLCVAEHSEALELGVKTVRVWWEEV